MQRAIDAFLLIIAADSRINGFFLASDPARLNTLLVEFLTELTGGPLEYTGRDMATVHAGMAIERHHFDALMEDLGTALGSLPIREEEIAELFALLDPMSADIVTA